MSYKRQRGWVATLLLHRSAVLKSAGASYLDLDKVCGIVKTTRTFEVPPFQTVLVHSLLCVKGHDKRINVMTDAPKILLKVCCHCPRYSYECKYWGRVSIGLRNLTSRMVVIKTQITIATLSAVNMVSPMIVPRVNIRSATISDSECWSQDKSRMALKSWKK